MPAPAVKVRTVALGSVEVPASGVRRYFRQPTGVPLDGEAGEPSAPRVLEFTAPSTEPFSAVGVTWRNDPDLGPVSVAVRTRPSPEAAWSSWSTTGHEAPSVDAAPASVRPGGELIWTGPSRSVEIVLTSVSGRGPADVQADLIDPGHGAVDVAAETVDIRAAEPGSGPDEDAPSGPDPSSPAPDGQLPDGQLPNGRTPGDEPPANSEPGPETPERSGPATPDPATPDPATPDPATPGPATPGSSTPAAPDSATPEPTASDPAPAGTPTEGESPEARSQAVSVGNGVASIYTRAEWGAPPKWMTWKPTYASAVKAVVIHHTATTNAYRPGDVPGMLRAIYRYHAISQKWGDIGYNVLVDRFGRAWEGRYGGLQRAVVGAHTGGFNTGTSGISMIGNFSTIRPTAAALRTVVRVAAWKLGSYRVNPRGSTRLTGGPNTKYNKRVTVTVPTMFPHRQTNATACPGNAGVLWMKWLRWRTAELLARHRVRHAASAPAPVKGWTSVPGGGLTAWGKGFGHGRGMSQYGAQAAAAKLNAAQITQFYYPGTTRKSIGNPVVRVRLRAVDGGHLVLRPPAGATRVTGVVALGGRRRVALPPQAGYHVVRSGKNIVIQKPRGRGWASVLVLSAPVSFVGPPVLRLQYNRAKAGCKGGYWLSYSGNLRVVLVGGVPYFVATMGMETYLRGVVSSEMPATWRAAAVQAQAMAARTYARSRLAPRRFYDVHDTTADQCWDGHAAYHRATDAAVRATAGLVIAYRGVPINAQYSADNGGRTAPGGRPYLPNKADPYAGASRSRYLRWTVTLSPAAMARFDGPGGIRTVRYVRVTSRTGGGAWGGRIVTILLSDGVRRPVAVSGNRFRTGMRLRSTYLGFSPG